MAGEKRQQQNQFEGLIKGLIDDKYGCSDDFVEAKTLTGLRENIRILGECKKLLSGGIGQEEGFHTDKKIRGDKIKWIDKNSVNEHEIIYLKKIGDFIGYLNKTCYTSINEFECHYANFEMGSFYQRHLDQFKGDRGRKFSIVLYLNNDWKQEDGGTLSLYPEDANQKDISPIGGRMVFFRSDEMEHQVNPSLTRDRTSIVGWFKS